MGSTRSDSVVSFNEDVTMNHIDNFRCVLNKRERYSIWYSDMEMSRMFVDGYNETMTAKLSNTNTDDVLVNGALPTATAKNGNTNRRTFSLTKKAANRVSNFLSEQTRRSVVSIRDRAT